MKFISSTRKLIYTQKIIELSDKHNQEIHFVVQLKHQTVQQGIKRQFFCYKIAEKTLTVLITTENC